MLYGINRQEYRRSFIYASRQSSKALRNLLNAVFWALIVAPPLSWYYRLWGIDTTTIDRFHAFHWRRRPRSVRRPA